MIQPILDNKGIFNSSYLNEDIVNLLDTTFEIPYSYNYSVFEVTEDYIARPDLISYDAYGDTMYTDVICKINGISNPFELNEGMILIIPSIEDITNFSVMPNSGEAEKSAVNNTSFYDKKPTPKQKNQKRKANEAVIGDSRFKIDPVAGIVIY